MDLQEWLRRQRGARSILAFAEHLSAAGFPVTDAALSRWETGARIPSLESIAGLADALGLSAGQRLDLYDLVAKTRQRESA
jgi:transcriptional regulator with XRE-family HTH domain